MDTDIVGNLHALALSLLAITGREATAMAAAAAAEAPAAASSWHTSKLSDLMEQLSNGLLPWSDSQAGHIDGMDPRLAKIKQQMGMVALDLRAATQEGNLVAFEVETYKSSIQEEIDQLQSVLAGFAEELSGLLGIQDDIEEQLSAASLDEQYDL